MTLRKHVGSIIGAICFLAVVVLALTGCSLSDTSYASDPNEYPWAVYVSVVPLPDGREVTCVFANSSALSCDWESIIPEPLEEEE